jgi:hypothetical protein
LLLIFIYIGYRSHSTEPIIELPHEYHREEINKDKVEWQRKQIESAKIKVQKQIFLGKNHFLR